MLFLLAKQDNWNIKDEVDMECYTGYRKQKLTVMQDILSWDIGSGGQVTFIK